MSVALNGDTPHRNGMGSGIGRLRSHLALLAEADPEAIRVEVIAQGRKPFIDGLIETLGETSKHCYSCHRSGKERWAFRLYAELAKLVGAAPEISLQIVNLVGSSVPVAKASVESVERARQMPDSAKCASMLDWLTKHGVEGVESLTIPESLQASSAEVMP